MSERRLFSKKDGTSFFDDLKSIFEDAKDAINLFFARLFGQLRNWYGLVGEPVVNFLEGVKAVIDKDSFTGSIFDTIVASTATPLDDVVLAWLRSNLSTVIERWLGFEGELDDVEEALSELLNELGLHTGSQRDAMIHSFASQVIEAYSVDIAQESGASPVIGRDADTLAQLSYDLFKSKV